MGRAHAVCACGYGCKRVHVGGACVQVCKWGTSVCMGCVCTHTRGSGHVCAVGGTHGGSCVCDCVRVCVLVVDGWARQNSLSGNCIALTSFQTFVLNLFIRQKGQAQGQSPPPSLHPLFWDIRVPGDLSRWSQAFGHLQPQAACRAIYLTRCLNRITRRFTQTPATPPAPQVAPPAKHTGEGKFGAGIHALPVTALWSGLVLTPHSGKPGLRRPFQIRRRA